MTLSHDLPGAYEVAMNDRDESFPPFVFRRFGQAGPDDALEALAGLRELPRTGHGEHPLYRTYQRVLDLIAECPGLYGPSFAGREHLRMGVWGLKSRWYKRLAELRVGTGQASEEIALTERQVHAFRCELGTVTSFPERDVLDWVEERYVPPVGERYDFGHLTAATAAKLRAWLADLESELASLRTMNDELAA